MRDLLERFVLRRAAPQLGDEITITTQVLDHGYLREQAARGVVIRVDNGHFQVATGDTVAYFDLRDPALTVRCAAYADALRARAA